MVFVRVSAAAVNDSYTREPGADGFQQKLIENKPGFLKIQAVKVQVGLNRKPAGTKIIQIKTAVRMDRSFDVFGSLFDLDITVPDKILECTQGILLVVLSLDLHRRTIVKRDSAPAERPHATHGKLKQLIIREIRQRLHWSRNRHVGHGLRGHGRDGRQVNSSLLDPLFQY